MKIKSRWAISLAVGLLASALLAVGVALSPAGVVSAVSGIATLALVAVTSAYVWLTSRLVRAQERAIQQTLDLEQSRAKAARRAEERQAVVQLWRLCHAHDADWVTIRSAFASLGQGENWTAIHNKVKALDEQKKIVSLLASDIAAQSPDVPHEVEEECWKTGVFLMRVPGVIAYLQICLLRVELEAFENQAQPLVEEARTLWTMEIRREADGLEWEDLVGGKVVSEAETQLDSLERTTYAFVRGHSSS